MSKKLKISLLFACALVLFSSVVFVAVMSVCGWDFARIADNEAQIVDVEINEDFSNIKFDTLTADIVIRPAADEKCKVTFTVPQKMKHSANVVGETLDISVSDERVWYERAISFYSTKVILYLPKSDYGMLSVSGSTGDIEIFDSFSFSNLDISLSTGDIECYASVLESVKLIASTADIKIGSLSCGSLEIEVSTGDIEVCDLICSGDATITVSTGKINLKNVSMNNLTSIGDTGDISLESVVAFDKFYIKRTTGDVSFDKCDAAEIYVKTSTGDVEGSFMSSKLFFAESRSGKNDVPKGTSGGICEITTTTGDIKITVE
ncbi:MAG: DUF4097 family beta strand repeat protein [Clostridia bacterium]|nr:DUF4097 family beta strand repeat protein [Clostridia bacterium]